VKKFFLLTAAFVAAVAVFVTLTLPARRLTLTPFPDGTIPGNLHIHTNRSDGRGTPEEIAAAAAQAGLKFLIFTDHGDGTRRPDRPAYHSGVLCIDGVEISTIGGHYVAFDLPAAPYPLGGEARDVVEDVRRLGGFGVAAHPDSPKPELRWREWTAPFDGLEWINPDTSWRVRAQAPGWRSRLRLAESLLGYPFRPRETIASLLASPETTMYRWDALAKRRRVVVLAGVDAHAKLALRDTDPGDNRYSLPFPGYRTSFETMSVHVSPDRPLTGDASADAALVVGAIRAGHLYVAVDGVASPPSFEFSATNRHGTVHAGDEIPSGGPLTLHVRSNAPAGFTTVVWRGTEVFATDPRHDFSIEAPEAPAVYRVAVQSAAATNEAAWVLSNPIYVRDPAASRQLPVRAAATTSVPMFDGKSADGWHVENDRTSLAAMDVPKRVGGSELRLRYGLSGGEVAGQVAALVYDTPSGVAPHDRVTFTTRAEGPMRISVQLRAIDAGGTTERWQRSIYVDAMDLEHTVYFDDLVPVGDTRTWRPALGNARSILFVVDTTNSRPGASGRLWIKSAAFQR
jgi:hypothetical protein